MPAHCCKGACCYDALRVVVLASSWFVRWLWWCISFELDCSAVGLVVVLVGCRLLQGRVMCWLVASASSWLLLVGSLKASDCACVSLDFLKCLKLEW